MCSVNFSDWIQDEILRSGYTRKEVAKLAGIPKNQLDSICNGICPSSYQSSKLSKALNISFDEMEGMISGDTKSSIAPIDNRFVQSSCSPEAKEKPGEKKKESKIKNSAPRLHDINPPKEKHCWVCNLPDDKTCYFHHCEVPYYKIKYGSGMARKLDDRLVIWAHHKCGTELSIHPDKDAPEIEHSRYEVVWSRLLIENKILQ